MNIDEIRGELKPLGVGEIDPHYLGFFELFNKQLFYEAHEVLEVLWLPRRRDLDGPFYKGLIQLAGAFVHLQKSRPQPTLSLLRLAEANFRLYPPIHHSLDLGMVLDLIRNWRIKVESERPNANP